MSPGISVIFRLADDPVSQRNAPSKQIPGTTTEGDLLTFTLSRCNGDIAAPQTLLDSITI